MQTPLVRAVVLATVVGILGGALVMALGLASFVSGPLLGGLYGLLFALLAASRATSPGAGLLWGLRYALLLWLAVPASLFAPVGGELAPVMLDSARAHFPELLAYLLCYGMPLGIAFGSIGKQAEQTRRSSFSLPRALVVGSLAGIVGGWAFGRWMEQIDFFLIIAGLVGSAMRGVGVTLIS